MTKKSIKSALISSVLALVLCFTMLVGTTFAWFTDTASSKSNTIKTGKLDAMLYQYNADGSLVDITTNSDPVFGADILWEPNATQVRYFQVKNAGSLAFKFKVALEVYGITNDLNEVMQYTVIPGANPVSAPVNSWVSGTDIVEGMNVTNLEDVELKENGDTYDFAIAVHMDKDAGNKYMESQIKFNINVIAAQLTKESDSFNDQYDLFASYPGEGKVEITGDSGYIMEIRNDEGYKIGSASVLAASVDPAADEVIINVNKMTEDYKGTFTVASGMEVDSFNVSATGIKANNDTPIKVQLRVLAGLDPNTVKLYHYSDEITQKTYNPNTGYVTFETTSFSPFSIVYNPAGGYVAPDAPEVTPNYPVANVTYESQYVNTAIEWGSMGGFAPDSSIDANPKLEAAFTFACPDLKETDALYKAYANWYCDFFVSLNRDLGENQIFLGGNYGKFGWIGFHNGDVTLSANQEIGLLTSVTTNPWTYADIAKFVKTFTCGVSDVNNVLNGATFTVKLRLINPEKVDTTVEGWWADLSEDAYIDVNVVTYTFGGAYNIQ